MGISARTHNFFTKLGFLVSVVALTSTLSGCLGTSSQSGGRKTTKSGVANTPSSVAEFQGRILADNPIILSGNPNLSETVDLNSILTPTPVTITDRERLEAGCDGLGFDGFISLCHQTQPDENSLPLTPISKRWAFDANSTEFLQVNTFYHQKKVVDSYMTLIRDMYSTKSQPNVAPPLNYQTSIPVSLFQKNAHWLGSKTLIGYANCGEPDNAFFDISKFTMCMGELSQFPQVKMGHDGSVVYHEMGHGLTSVYMNMRTIGSSLIIPERSNIGYGFYDEAGSINEGIADFFSYFINGRTHFGEWSLGRFLNASRPMTEDDPLHIPGLSTAVADRINYPEFVNYDPNFPDEPVEDVHLPGMIISHMMTSFNRDMQAVCGMTLAQANNVLMQILIELYAELGDLSSSASDHSKSAFSSHYTINHYPEYDESTRRVSELWVSSVTPITFRSFSQKFAKYAYQILSKDGKLGCNGVNYPVDYLEQLLDSYGLLLFDNYNENGNHFSLGHTGTSRQINPINRVKSTLINKDLIKLDSRPDQSPAFIFDGRGDLINAVEVLQAGGIIKELSTQIPSDLPYNNGNGAISPGEVVGIALNLYNDSNSSMGGVQVLANDWDHAKFDGQDKKPCNIFDDAWPLSSEGAASVSSEDSINPTQGNCHFITRLNGNPLATTGGTRPASEASEELHPICFVQVEENGATIWASQEKLRENLGVEPEKCLGGSTSEHDCFFRVIKGAESSRFSRIDPKKNWGETLATSDGAPTFQTSNVIFFEASPDIPPGTTFDCRFRARFTNCKDCYADQSRTDLDDFLDYEYSGAEPFKILHYQFVVID
jgi:hypothetical protein